VCFGAPCTGASSSSTSAASTASSLSAVSQFLSDMMTRLDEGTASDPEDDALFRTNDGHGRRVIVEQMQDGAVAITIRTSQDPRDAHRALLSRHDAIALREALEGI
jgi:hypothetical protein